MLATAGGHTDILEQLTGSGALEAGSHMEDRAVRAAAGAGHGEAVSLLLTWGERRRDQILGAVVAAARRGHTQIVRTMLDLCPDLRPTSTDPVTGLSPLTAAAEGGDVDIVRSLIQASPEDSLVTLTCPDGQGHVPIHVAAMHGHVSVVELCLELSCDPEQGRGDEVTSALELAAGAGHCGLVRLLVSRGAEVGGGALTQAIRGGQAEVSVM